MNRINLPQNENEKYLDLLGSKEFPEILKSYNLGYSLYNKLFAAHIITIGFQTSGINEGSVHLKYGQAMDLEAEKAVFCNFRPSIEFSFFTRTNALIQTSRYRSTRASINTYNKNNSYTLDSTGKEYYRPIDFQEFLTEYISKLDMLSDAEHIMRLNQSLSENENDYIKIKFRNNGKKHQEKIDNAFEQIIFNHPEINSFLQFHFMKNNLTQEALSNTKKIKI